MQGNMHRGNRRNTHTPHLLVVAAWGINHCLTLTLLIGAFWLTETCAQAATPKLA